MDKVFKRLSVLCRHLTKLKFAHFKVHKNEVPSEELFFVEHGFYIFPAGAK